MRDFKLSFNSGMYDGYDSNSFAKSVIGDNKLYSLKEGIKETLTFITKSAKIKKVSEDFKLSVIKEAIASLDRGLQNSYDYRDYAHETNIKEIRSSLEDSYGLNDLGLFAMYFYQRDKGLLEEIKYRRSRGNGMITEVGGYSSNTLLAKASKSLRLNMILNGLKDEDISLVKRIYIGGIANSSITSNNNETPTEYIMTFNIARMANTTSQLSFTLDTLVILLKNFDSIFDKDNIEKYTDFVVEEVNKSPIKVTTMNGIPSEELFTELIHRISSKDALKSLIASIRKLEDLRVMFVYEKNKMTGANIDELPSIIESNGILKDMNILTCASTMFFAESLFVATTLILKKYLEENVHTITDIRGILLK